jgi:hypothetical protein
MAGLILVLGRCDLANPTEPQSLVVEAFFTTDRPLPSITLRRTRPLDAPGSRDDNAAAGAAIEVVLDGESLSYEEQDARPGLYVPEAALGTVPADVPWALTVEWRDEAARAQGRTPPLSTWARSVSRCRTLRYRPSVWTRCVATRSTFPRSKNTFTRSTYR